ncbi:Protein suppressor of hairy wing [Gryllus bimaculatus]|nr:Protein suppressor of hairy wing [Gryllus bimaculatus]
MHIYVACLYITLTDMNGSRRLHHMIPFRSSYNGNSDDAVCPLCGKILRKTSLKRHITDRHNPGQYVPCKICGYHPPNEDIFKYLRYQCEICQKFFTRRDHLTTHFKNLHGEDAGPFSCIVCSQLYKNADSGGKQTVERVGPLASNAQPPKEFVCSVCGKNFIRKGSLHAHFQNIHGILQGPFPCGLCGSLLKNKKSLDTHMLSHKKNLFKH